MKTYELKKSSLYGAREIDSTELIKTRLLIEVDTKVITALEQAIDGDDSVRINNIMTYFTKVIFKETGVWYDDIDYYNDFGDNLNGYISLLIYRINKAIV